MLLHSALRTPRSALWPRSAFTLMELLIVMMIMTLLAGLALSALAGATEAAREQRTRAIIAKIDSLIMERYESYRTRAVPVRVQAGSTPRVAAQLRLNALRELMRLEMPDRISDLCVQQEYTNDLSDDSLDAIPAQFTVETNFLKAPPSLALSYKRRVRKAMYADGLNNPPKPWTRNNQGSECLYLILSSMHDGDKNALDYFDESEIGDTDGDYQKEILDAWGQPIHFFRWAPGFIIENGAITAQTSNTTDVTKPMAPDSFDPGKADTRWQDANTLINPFELKPLIVSTGRDRELDLNPAFALVYQIQNASGIRNDPYSEFGSSLPGQPFDLNGDSEDNSGDNISNHFLQTP